MAREAILNRVVVFESRKERVRPTDWNIVNTELGMMWEPRNITDINLHLSVGATGDGIFADVDLDDCINRVDRIEFFGDNRDPFHRDPDSNEKLIGGFLRQGVGRDFSDPVLDLI